MVVKISQKRKAIKGKNIRYEEGPRGKAFRLCASVSSFLPRECTSRGLDELRPRSDNPQLRVASMTVLDSRETGPAPSLHVFVLQSIYHQITKGQMDSPQSAPDVTEQAPLHPEQQAGRTKQLTIPLELLTPFILIFVTNLTKGCASGYLGPHSILRLYIRFS